MSVLDRKAARKAWTPRRHGWVPNGSNGNWSRAAADGKGPYVVSSQLDNFAWIMECRDLREEQAAALDLLDQRDAEIERLRQDLKNAHETIENLKKSKALLVEWSTEEDGAAAEILRLQTLLGQGGL